MSTFGLKLRDLRQRAGLTQEQLSERAGVDRTTLARLETDVSVPTWPTVLALARTLGVKADDFPDVAAELKTSRGKPAAKQSGRRPRKK